MLNKDFKNDFLVQYSHLLNTALNRDTILAAIAHFKSLYKYELPRPNQEIASHLRRVPLSIEKWEKKVEHLNQFAKLRYKFVKKELPEVFNIEGWSTLTIQGEVGRISINDNRPLCLPFNGEYLQGTSFSVCALDDGNFSFVSWSDGDTNRMKTVEFFRDFSLSPLYDFIETQELVEENSFAENISDRQEENSFSIVIYDLLFRFGLILFILGLLFIGVGFWRIKKARLSGL